MSEPLTGEQRLSLRATAARWEWHHRQADARKLANAFFALLVERDGLAEALQTAEAKLQRNPGGYYWWIRVKDAHGDCPFGSEQCELCDVLYGGELP